MLRQVKLVAAISILALAGCGPLDEGMEKHQRIVAQVDGYSLTIDQAARLLATGEPEMVPLQPATVDRLVEMWIGYTILASELAGPDTFAGVQTDALVEFARDQELVWLLQERVIIEPASPSDEQLRAEYEREEPYSRVEAQHILIRVAEHADSAAVDSALERAREVRRRAEAGENFAELARRYSEDAATAARGGSLGWVERGQLVDPLDRTIFELETDELSEPIRSVFGYHIVKVVDREVPDFESVAEAYRGEILGRRSRGLEQAYIDSLFEAADLRFVSGFVPLVKQLSITSRLARLSPTERRASLVRYDGGELTVGEWADFVIRGGQNIRTAFASRDSAGVRGLLREMVRNELLVKAARDEGLALSESTLDSLKAHARRDLRGGTLAAGLRPPELDAEEEESIARAVDTALTELISGQRGPRPVERLYPALRRGHAISTYPGRFDAVLRRLVELRAESQQAEPAAPAAPEV